MATDKNVDPRLREAIKRFHRIWHEARAGEPWEADAMVLATAAPDGKVSARTVLLKVADEAGFVFYSNYDSRKGRELAANPRASLCFLWRSIRRQVLVEGEVARLDPHESDAYFARRTRLAQLGAWASRQSAPMASRDELEDRLAALDRKYAGTRVPRPPHWGGYRLSPELIEFWAPGEGRLNERERYVREESGAWRFGLVFP